MLPFPRYHGRYTMEPGTESDHICTVTNLPTDCAPAGLVWSTYLNTFVVTLGCNLGGGAFQWATSDDLITWSDPMPLDITHNMPANVSKMVVGKVRNHSVTPTLY